MWKQPELAMSKRVHTGISIIQHNIQNGNLRVKIMILK